MSKQPGTVSASGGKKRPKKSAIRRASRHSPLSSLMMVVLPVVAAAAFGYFLYAAGMFERATGAKTKAPPKQVSTKRVSLVKPRMTRFDKKSRTYVVRARSAAREVAKPDIVNLDKVNTEIRLPKSATRVHVTSDKGVFNRKTDVMTLISNVVMQTTDGYRATLARATVWLKTGELASKTPVILYMPRGTVAANGLEVLDNGRRLRFLNRARMVIEATGNAKK
jgi:lipopolysaccharide export system protein LptC